MSLTKQKESLLRERDKLTAEIGELNKRVQQQQMQNDTIEKKRVENEEKCRDLYRMLDVSWLRTIRDAMARRFLISVFHFHVFAVFERQQETSSEAFKEKRCLDQLKVILNDVTAEKNAIAEQLKHSRKQVSRTTTVDRKTN